MATLAFTPSDQSIRHKAISQIDAVSTVQAGAGTGKTSLLVERYLQLVKDGLARPTEIVAITFTEEASSELRERIRKRLKENALSKALDELDRAPISTIHSFAASLLRERPFEAGIDPSFQQMDAIASQLFLQSSYDHWFAEASNLNKKPLSRAISAGIRFSKIRELASLLYLYRDLWNPSLFSSSSLNIEEAFSEITQEVKSLWTLAERACVDTQDDGYQAIQSLYQDLNVLTSSSKETKERAFLLRLEVKTNKGNQKKWADPALCKEQKQRMRTLAERLSKIQQNLRTEIFVDLLNWLKSFVDYVEKEKIQQGKLDFDDLLFRARDLLEQNLDVRKYFQKKYRFFLVDEFQDTDPVQTEIIWRLAGNEQMNKSWMDLPLTPGKLFVVGDPKQSIYRFRGASIETYLETTQKLREKGREFLIQQNFRSNEALISWVNSVFSPILKDYKPLTALPKHRSYQGQGSILVLEAPETTLGESTVEMRRLEAEAIAAFLKNLIQSQHQIFDDAQGFRSVQPGDIAILFPSKTDIDVFEEMLRQYGLPFSLEGGSLFFHRAEIQGVLNTLEAIAHPTDPIAVVAALRSILFGCSDQDLLKMAEKNLSLDYRTSSSKELPQAVSKAFSILQNLHEVYAELSPSQVISRILDKTSALTLALGRFHGEQAAANLEKLISIARERENAGMNSLDRFVQWVRERREEADQTSESPLTEAQGARMRLLTVHRSKGLEFPVVVLANLSVDKRQSDPVIANRFTGSLAFGFGPQNSRFCTPNYEIELEKERGFQEEEKKRLLYVATTRAKDLLILPRFVRSRQRPSSYWKILEKGLEHGKAFVQSIPFSKLPIHTEIKPSSVRSQGKKRKKTFSLRDQQKEIRKQLSIRSETLIPGIPIQTATSLVHSNEKSIAKRVSSSARKGRVLGLALHTVFERISFQDKKLSLSTLCNIVAQEMGFQEHSDELCKLAQSALKAPIFSRIQKAKQIFKEVPFSLNSKGNIFEGIMDLVFEEHDGWVILDYKTDHIQPFQIQERTLHYAPQLNLYRKAFEQITQQPIKEALLFFVRLGKTVNVSKRPQNEQGRG